MVNQKLGLGTGFQPCSTVKVSVALAALHEKLVTRSNPIHLYGRTHMDLTNALAHSNNYYFANLGVQLGYERMNYYAHLFGYGEKAGLNIPGEQAGFWPAAPPRFVLKRVLPTIFPTSMPAIAEKRPATA